MDEKKPRVNIPAYIWMSLAVFGWTVAALEFVPPKDTTTAPLQPISGGVPPTPSPIASLPGLPTPTSSGTSGTFDGDTQQTKYGPVQVQITVSGNKITNVVALQYPTSAYRSQQLSQTAIPTLVQETLTAQSSAIQAVSGASYTSQGFYNSLVSALSKAGL